MLNDSFIIQLRQFTTLFLYQIQLLLSILYPLYFYQNENDTCVVTARVHLTEDTIL